jgi:hypothetical protein
VEIAQMDKNISLLHRCLYCKQTHTVQIDIETMQLRHKAANSPEISIDIGHTADWGHRTMTNKRNVQHRKLAEEGKEESFEWTTNNPKCNETNKRGKSSSRGRTYFSTIRKL